VPRDRSRDRVTRPDDTAAAEDGSDDAEDDDDPTPDLSERDGTIGDLLDDQVGNVSQQVLSGSQANLRIAPEVNPGFIDTEVVNRMGLVLSLNLEFDPSRQQWVPAVVDKTERQAVEQTLAEDQATDDPDSVVDPGNDATTDSDGNLKLGDGLENETDPSSGSTTAGSVSSEAGFVADFDPGTDSIWVELDDVPNPPNHLVVQDEQPDYTRREFDISGPRVEVPVGFADGDNVEVYFSRDGDDYDRTTVPVDSFPIDIPGGSVTSGRSAYGSSDSEIYNVIAFGSAEQVSEASASSTFDNPCTATSTRTAQYDVCSKSSDVTVDLYNGDPNSDDSTLLARDIDQREDVTDLPDSFTDLQYKLTLRRDEDGDSPKVSRLGHQLIR
jgi:hypothetical protein